MKNLVLTFLLALLVVVTCVSIRQMVCGTSAGQKPALVAIGGAPVPPIPPPPPTPEKK